MPAPIRDHALLSDCRTAALVARDGTVDWWPAPRFDSPSAFSALLDDDAGHWSLRPREPFEATWRYLPGTLVLETTMRTAGGTLRVSDALAFAAGARGHEIGRAVPHALVRVAEALDGAVAVELECVPRLEYGLAVPRLVEEAGGVASVGGPERVFLRGERPLAADGGRACASFDLRAGERAGWVLHRAAGAFAEPPPPLDPHATLADPTAASFWLSECHARAGRGDRAEAVFERAAAAANDLGLLAEEVDPRTGDPLGNVPLAISHVGLVNAAAALTEARQSSSSTARASAASAANRASASTAAARM